MSYSRKSCTVGPWGEWMQGVGKFNIHQLWYLTHPTKKFISRKNEYHFICQKAKTSQHIYSCYFSSHLKYVVKTICCSSQEEDNVGNVSDLDPQRGRPWHGVGRHHSPRVKVWTCGNIANLGEKKEMESERFSLHCCPFHLLTQISALPCSISLSSILKNTRLLFSSPLFPHVHHLRFIYLTGL